MLDRHLVGTLLAGALVAIAGCTGGPGPSAVPTRLVLLTHDAFKVSDGVLERFETAHGVDVQLLQGGDAGAMVNQAILTKAAPLADVLYGIDNTFLSRATNAGIFDPYLSPSLPSVPDALRVDLPMGVTPIDYGDVCLNYDKQAFAGDLRAPTSLAHLMDPAYSGMLVVENPATSSPGLAFMLATRDVFANTEITWLDFWRGLRDNDVLVVDDWDTAYYSSFSGGAGAGDRPIVVSYATSPAAEVVFADPPVSEAPTGVVTDGCFRQIEYAGVLHGTKAPELAGQFVEFMLSPEFQQDIPLNMYVFPARSGLDLPAVFLENAARVTTPTLMDPALDAAAIEGLITEWTDVVLH
jgi:thiamine transport system substrate-binding protein